MGAGTDPALPEIEQAYAEGSLVVVVGPALAREAGFPSADGILGLLLDRARKSKPSEEEALGELAELVEARRVPEAFSAAKRLLGAPLYGDVIEKALGDGERAVPPLGRAVAALAPLLWALAEPALASDRGPERRWQVIAGARGRGARRGGEGVGARGACEVAAGCAPAGVRSAAEPGPRGAGGAGGGRGRGARSGGGRVPAVR